MSNLGYIQTTLKDPLLSVSFFCHLASIILCALILSETLVLYKSFTYLLTYIAEGGETSSAESEAKSSPAVGDVGSDSGDIVPGKSVVFASLEVCLCALVRHLPSLNPSLSAASVLASSARQTSFTDTTYRLLSTVLLTMAELPGLCSPSGQFFNVYSFFVELGFLLGSVGNLLIQVCQRMMLKSYE